jgi:transcriptional regulator with XRE-family HTH domain
MPVYQSHRLDTDQLGFGGRIRSVRRARRLTLREVAQQAGLSPAFLSRIENEHLRLDFDAALRLAQAMGVPIEELLPRDVSAPYQIVRHQDLRDDELRRVPLAGASGQAGWHPNRFRPLADLFVGRHLEPAMARVLPEPDEGEPSPTLCAHHEQEFLFVVRGRIEFLIKTPDGLRRFELEPGDSIYFWSSLPHRSRALDATAAQTLHVFAAEPGFSDQGNLWLLSPYVDVMRSTGDEDTDQLQIVGRDGGAARGEGPAARGRRGGHAWAAAGGTRPGGAAVRAAAAGIRQGNAGRAVRLAATPCRPGARAGPLALRARRRARLGRNGGVPGSRLRVPAAADVSLPGRRGGV